MELENHARLYQISENSYEKQFTKKESEGNSKQPIENSQGGNLRDNVEKVDILDEEVIIDD